MGWASGVQGLLDQAVANNSVPGAVAVATDRDGEMEQA